MKRIIWVFLKNAHIYGNILLVYVIGKQAIKLWIERRRNIAGSLFKRNLFLAFFSFSLLLGASYYFLLDGISYVSISGWQYVSIVMFLLLLVVFLSILFTVFVATGISRPFRALIPALDRIRKGEWGTRVHVQTMSDFNKLIIGFNEMASTLERVHTHLESHNKQMLTVLEHIKEAVFFVDNVGRMITFNVASKDLIEKYLNITRFKNKKVSFFGLQVTREFFALVKEMKREHKLQLSKEISFVYDGEPRTFMVHMTTIKNILLQHQGGLLVVVEDLTEVFKVNKIKTWQEAAKQIAHEIKNPLTPIQLATQRLQRKLSSHDPVLVDCTNTILNQVKIIKNLVAHFSEFARMPDSVIEAFDINRTIREVLSLYQMSYSDIEIIADLHDHLPLLRADKKKIKRVLVNLLDNSVRALHEHEKRVLSFDSLSSKKITIKTSFKTGRNLLELLIADNGPGIPKEVKGRLFLPAVTSSKKNMGLGLAIVHDVVRTMGGSIKLMESYQGATFQILLPV